MLASPSVWLVCQRCLLIAKSLSMSLNTGHLHCEAVGHTLSASFRLPLRRSSLRCTPAHLDNSSGSHVTHASVTAPEAAETVLPPRPEPRWTPQQYAGLWTEAHEERYQVENIEGTIPQDLELGTGTWFRNGPGQFEIDGEPLHVFDGHGFVARIAISGGKAQFASRFVRTPVFEEERRRNKVLYRGFGTQKPGGWLANLFDIRDKPTANTSLVEWAGKLYALWEMHRPFVLDPVTLETHGEEDLGGYLKCNQAFCAHPQLDRETGRLCAFSLGLRGAEGNLHIFEMDEAGAVVKTKTLKDAVFNPVTYLHDFSVTSSWYVFYRPPLKPNMRKLGEYLLGRDDQTKMIDFDSGRPGQWLLVSREAEGPTIEIDTPPMFIWHHAACSEDPATGVLTVDACIFDTFSPGSADLRDPSTMSSKSTLCRCVVDPKQGTATRTELVDVAADFPTINAAFAGRADYRFVYAAACTEPGQSIPFQSVVKIDVQTRSWVEWKAPAGCFVGEAVFVARRDPSSRPASQQPANSSQNSHSSGSSHNVGGSSSDGSGSEGHSRGGPAVAAQQRNREDDGFLITPMYDGGRDQSSVVILDAQNPAAGPVAKLNLKSVMPFAFHCLWSPNFYGLPQT